ncbi:hypothetical protein [Acinetobacter sp. MD2]|uniref:hypothetical protein n=1 Tax=Acinetobacter sp. MD2 TaxID=2600066 RepID=UPI002D1E6F18|nr:hypothetical protein [Acinetobacter sp. MD2]MEB3767727.1 hypothetical protein [Acinetobacter sp. MD2]
MKDLELKCYEEIAKKIHADGVETLAGGNPCTYTASLLVYLEEYLKTQSIESSIITALADDLLTEDQKCKDLLSELGDDRYGY